MGLQSTVEEPLRKKLRIKQKGNRRRGVTSSLTNEVTRNKLYDLFVNHVIREVVLLLGSVYRSLHQMSLNTDHLSYEL